MDIANGASDVVADNLCLESGMPGATESIACGTEDCPGEQTPCLSLLTDKMAHAVLLYS